MLSMKKIYNPCFKCERRVIGCHGTCEDYIKYQEEIKMNANVFSNYAADEIVDKVLIGNLERRKRRRGKR